MSALRAPLNDREKWVAAKSSSPFAEVDFLGRRVPHHPGLPDYLLMVARIEPGRVRRVPAPAIAEEGVDDEGEFSMVACPCGAHPIVRSRLEKCVDCERYYVGLGLGSVFLTYGAMTPPPLPMASAINDRET